MEKLPPSPGTREVVKRGRIAASRLGHDCLGPEHYLIAIAELGEEVFAAQILLKLGLDLALLRDDLANALPAGTDTIGDVFSEKPSTRRMLDAARQNAERLHHDRLGTEHLLLGLLEANDPVAARLLNERGVDHAKALALVGEVIAENDPSHRPQRKAAEWSGFRAEMNRRILRRGTDLTRRFFGMDKRAFEPGAIDALSKELMGLSANLVLRCEDCAIYHLQRCRALGMTEEQFWEAIDVGLVTGGSVVIPLARRLLALWDELEEDAPRLANPSDDSIG